MSDASTRPPLFAFVVPVEPADWWLVPAFGDPLSRGLSYHLDSAADVISIIIEFVLRCVVCQTNEKLKFYWICSLSSKLGLRPFSSSKYLLNSFCFYSFVCLFFVLFLLRSLLLSRTNWAVICVLLIDLFDVFASLSAYFTRWITRSWPQLFVCLSVCFVDSSLFSFGIHSRIHFNFVVDFKSLLAFLLNFLFIFIFYSL